LFERLSRGSIGGGLWKFYDIFVSLDALVSVDLAAVLVTALLEFAGLVISPSWRTAVATRTTPCSTSRAGGFLSDPTRPRPGQNVL